MFGLTDSRSPPVSVKYLILDGMAFEVDKAYVDEGVKDEWLVLNGYHELNGIVYLTYHLISDITGE